jgi:hypothetical protein
MKTFTFFILLLLIATGAFAGMLYAHVVPVSDLADRVPGAGSALASLGLYPSPPTTTPASNEIAPPNQTSQTGQPGQQNVAAQPQPLPQPPTMVHYTHHRSHSHRSELNRLEDAARGPEVTARLARIYDTMPASFVARIIAHQSDYEAARELSAMDENKAGEVIASLDPMRAARIAAVMAGQSEPTSSSSGSSDEVSIE